MRILIISTYFPPLNSIASLRPYSWAKSWSKAGHDVMVLTTVKSNDATTPLNLSTEFFKVKSVPIPEWIIRLKNRYHSSNTSSLPNFYTTGWKQSLKKALSTFYHFLRYKKGLFNTCRMPDFSDFWIRPALKVIENEIPWDFVISTAGPYATHMIAAKIKKRKQAHFWVADYRDAWSDSRIYPGLFPFNQLEAYLEKKLVGRANMITTVSASYAKAYTVKFPHIKTVTIENGFDSSDLLYLSTNSIFPDDGKFRIVYTGSIYAEKQDPSVLFESIAIIAKDNTNAYLLDRLEVIFVGPNQQPLQKLIEKYHVKAWVKLKGFVSREDALRMQRDAHALLFLAWNDPATDGVMTGKLFEYLYSKTPILSINNCGIEASQKLIMEANAGVVYANLMEIVEWLRSHLVSPVKNCSKIDPQLLNRYDRHFLAMKLLDHVSRNISHILQT